MSNVERREIKEALVVDGTDLCSAGPGVIV